MAKFYGEVGYGEYSETAPGVWEELIIHRHYYGDVVKNSRQLTDGEGLNKDISIQNSISIVADAYANEHFFAIRYVKWAGAYWTVADVTVQSPRLLLRLGGVYNGPTGGTTDSVDEPLGNS